MFLIGRVVVPVPVPVPVPVVPAKFSGAGTGAGKILIENCGIRGAEGAT